VILSDDAAEITRGDVPSPDVRVRGPGMSIASLFLGKSAVPADVEVEGSAATLRSLRSAFATSETDRMFSA